MLGSEPGQEVADKYRQLARVVMAYERQHFETWAAQADAAAMLHLKQPVLTKKQDGSMQVLLGVLPVAFVRFARLS